MRDETIARNYAEALFDLANRHEGIDTYGAAIEMVAALIDENPSFRAFLETPRIDADKKNVVLKKAFADQVPVNFLNFLQITVDKRRQKLLREIAEQFKALVDEHMNRTHVTVTVARNLDESSLQQVADKLSALLDKTAIPDVRVKPEILGGVIVRAGDTIYDGSLRRRLDRMRRQLLAADMPTGLAGAE